MASPGRRLYIGRIPPEAQRVDIEKYFGRYGTLLDVRIMAGFGFLEYDQVRDAEDAVHDLNGREFMGDRLIVEFAKAPRGGREVYGGGYGGSFNGPRRAGFRLLVKGLSHETSWQDLKDFARQAGNVIRADVDRNMAGEGLIEYSSQDDADNALRKLDGADLKGSIVTVYEDRPGGGGGGRRDRSRSPSYRDRSDRRGGGYDRDRRRSPPSRDDRERDRGYERKERDRSREPRERSRERSMRREPLDEIEKV